VDSQDTDVYAEKLQHCITSAMIQCVPLSKYRPHVRPYWDSELKVLHTEQLRLRHVWILEGKPRGDIYISYINYKTAKRIFARALRQKQDNFYQDEYEQLEHAADVDTKYLWKNFKSKRDYSSSPLLVDNILVTSPTELCKVWERYYTDLLNEQSAEAERYDSVHADYLRNKIEQLKGTCSHTNDVTGTLSQSISVNEIATVCKQLKTNKAAGHDGIPNEALKLGGHQLFVLLTYLFNNIIRLGYIPGTFKHSIIIPLYKGKHKPRTLLNSYRGVSLTVTLNKVLEKVIIDRLNVWLRDRHFPPPLQQAGRTGTNCVSLAYAVQEAITHITSQQSKVYGCFLDIQSAYDVIHWDGLLVKMAQLGIKGKLWHLFRDWLSGSTAQVRAYGKCSDVFQISRSIKQGGLLSVFYFVAFYHDIHDYVKKGNTQQLMFHGVEMGSPTMADDTLLLSTTVNGLQVMLNNAFKYGRQWRLTYSPTKCKCITFGESHKKQVVNQNKRQWYLGDTPLEEVSTYNYLGIILSADGSSKYRTGIMSKKGYSCYGVAKSSGFHSEGLSPITCSTVWQRMIAPSMLYGCELWHNLTKKEINSLEVVQTKVGKSIQSLHRRTHNEIVRGLLGWSTMVGQIDSCKLQFMRKLMSLPTSNIIKHIFLCQIFGVVCEALTNPSSITFDLWRIVMKYNLQGIMTDYLLGKALITKHTWKQYIKEAVSSHERQKSIDGLERKGAHRFGRVHDSLSPHPIYQLVRHNMNIRKDLLNTLKLLAYPEVSEPCICNLCDEQYVDTVEHYLMRCQNYSLITIRNEAWGIILDSIDCIAEAQLLSQDDSIILDTLLSKRWSLFKSDEAYNTFSCVTANELTKLMYVV